MSGSTRPFMLVYAASSAVLRRARELGIEGLECEVEAAIHKGCKRNVLPDGLGTLAKDERSIILADGNIVVVKKGRGTLGVRRAFHVVRLIPRPPAGTL
jgi:hypothetical protein